MRIHELKLKSSRGPIRPGRGISGGRGKTAGRGTKGQNSRTGGGVRPGFEGGQNPLSARLPKLPGFTSRRVATATVSLSDLARLKVKIITNQTLAEAGVINRASQPAKVVASGKLTTAKTVHLQSASKAAAKAIAKAGGKFAAVPTPKARTAQAKSDKKT